MLEVVSVPCHEDVITIPVLPKFLSGCKVTSERMAQSKDRHKIEDRCYAFVLLFS
jgi:hypothetical protein